MSESTRGACYLGGDELAIDRGLWVTLIRALDGDQAARDDSRDHLLKAAPNSWDADLDAEECPGWQPRRPVIVPRGEA